MSTASRQEHIERAFSTTLHSFRRPGTARLGVTVGLANDLGNELDVTITFLAGQRYCCFEHGCHYDFGRARFWRRLREEMAGLNCQPLEIIRHRVNVESGVLQEDSTQAMYPLESTPWCYALEATREAHAKPTGVYDTRTIEDRVSAQLRDAEERTRSKPDDSHGWLLLAGAFIGDWKQQQRPLREAIRSCPSDMFLRGNLVQCLGLSGQHADVVVACDAILQIQPDLEWAHALRIAAQSRM